MKRTTQRADRFESGVPEFVSGCRQFEGEDRMYNERMAANAQQQRDWCEQQIREKKAALAAQ